MYERLVACGFTDRMASDVFEICQTADEAEAYVRMIELLYAACSGA